MGWVRLVVVVLGCLVFAPTPAQAAFHLWQIKEVFSNADGSVQYIELFTTASGQEFVDGHTITTDDGTTTRTFTFPANSSSGTANKHLLIATPGFARLSGAVTPDFTLPCGPFFSPNATTISITFDGADSEMFLGATLPKDGANSLTDSNLGGTSAFVASASSPVNFAGSSGSIALTTEQNDGTAPACDDGLFCNGPETCSAGACNGVAPCSEQCIEATDTCVECVNAGHCNDNNVCTDDVCNGVNECENPNNTASCDDGLFCNGADTCSAGACVHAGDPCAGINCNEGPDTCANCTGAADCEDGESCTIDTCTTGVCGRANAVDGAECDTDGTFCNGVGSCAGGVCGSVMPPCDATTETCDEPSASCDLIPVAVDAGMMPINPVDDDGGGCCQTGSSPATFTGPGLVLALGLLVGRRRRRRESCALRRTRPIDSPGL